jgi:hypothetical protein
MADDELPIGDVVLTLRKTLRDTTRALELHGVACQDALAALDQIGRVLDVAAAQVAKGNPPNKGA